MNSFRRTKIVCTLGPGTDSEGILRGLFSEGMNVGRLNFSHGSHEEHLVRIETFRRLRDELNIPAGVMLDTKGPEIRIRKFENGKIELKKGDTFTITTDDIAGNNERVSVKYTGLTGDVEKGDMLLLDDGLIELKITKVTSTDIVCTVISGGELSNNKKINVPEKKIRLPFISEADISDLKFGAAHNVDFAAASFVRNSADVKALRRVLYDAGGAGIKIISKIESREGVDNIDEIIRVSDGIMVARGDMGVEIPFEELPAIQKMIIKKTCEAGKPVITATQMLDSMIRNPRPTRAEITDVANAIYDGTSAIMLSGETSVGKYPVDAVRTMAKIAVETEENIDYAEDFSKKRVRISNNVTNAISHATCLAADTLGASAIVAVTQSGHTARMISRYRPACRIIAPTTSETVYQQLSLSWAVTPIMTETGNSTDEIFSIALKSSIESGLISGGDLVVLTGGTPAGISGTTNTMKVHIVGDVLVRGKGINSLKATAGLYVVDDSADGTEHFSAGDIVVIKKTEDRHLPLLRYASAIITEENADDSKAVVLGRALEIPVITEAEGASKILKSGTVVSVNAENGTVSTTGQF
jgi:pyruvate kinase